MTVGNRENIRAGRDAYDNASWCIIREAVNSWKGWFVRGNDASHSNIDFLYVTSEDGVAWSDPIICDVRPKATLPNDLLWHNSIYPIGKGIYYMVSSGAGIFESYIKSGYETKIIRNTKTICPALGGTGWGGVKYYRPCLIKHADGAYRLYISACDNSNVWHIGYVDVDFIAW